MTRQRPLALVLLAALGACADGSELPPGLQCRADPECEAPLSCSFNHCVAREPNALVLMARLTPPVSSQLLPQQVAALSLADGPDLLVELLPSAVVRGVVTIDGDTFTLNVPGEIEVRASDVIAGAGHRFTALSRVELGLDGYGFELVVLPGRTYEGTFRPADDELPVHRFTLDAKSVESGRLDIVLPARSAYGVVSGRVRTGEGPKPILDARVVVLGEDDGVLAVTRTDPERGQFEVLVAPEVTSVRLKIESPSGGPVFPDFVSGPHVVGEYVDVIVPDPPANVAAYDAVLRVLVQGAGDEGATPVEGLTVTLQGKLDGGTLRRTATTDADGEAHFRVLAGSYECLIVVPPDRPFSSWHGTVDLSPQALIPRPDAWTVTLWPRPTFSGRIVDAFGRPVSAGKLTFERRVARQEGELLAIAPPPITAPLGADGTFALQVDPGTWDLMVAPDPTTGAPHAHEAAIEVGPDGLHLELDLPMPGLIHLTVAGPDGVFRPDVTVDLWLPSGDAPRLLARGTTGKRGFVDLLVPHATSPSL
ncbi:MAG: hypothetical protein IT385_29385 [Deltaproteobacteria bacterium]|nr:hypothetical protein [Deltaproteobacteria bacterium]